jgi:DNA primase
MDFARQLKDSVSIIDVISPYVRLKRVGVRYVGLCPFHNEKTPSFNVNPANGWYKCFGCGVGGDLISFVVNKENITFYEALQMLSERFGIPMPKRQPESDQAVRNRWAAFRANEIAVKLYRDSLQSAEGEAARDYIKRRGLSADALEQFQVGFAPRQSDLISRLRQEKMSDSEMEGSGLVGKSEEGRIYERFRGRLMFPIQNDSGKVVGFGGRAMEEGQEPKYLNSPKTEIYDKSRILYNFHRAKNPMREKNRAVLVEGYMDVIGAWVAGVAEAVAPCGTALTDQQAANIKRMSDTVVINFDPDQAGLKAAERGLELLLDAGLKVNVLHLPAGLDPDEFVQKHGGEEYQQLITKAPSYFYWLSEVARKRFNLRNPEEKLEAVKFLLAAAQRMPGRMERAMIASEMANSLGIDPNLLLQRLKVTRSPELKSKATEAAAAKSIQEAVPRSERLLLNILLHDPVARQHLGKPLQGSAVFPDLELRSVFETLFQFESPDNQDWSQLVAQVEEKWRPLVEKLLLEPPNTDTEQEGLQQAIECIRALEHNNAERGRRRIREEISQAEKNGERQLVMQLMGQLQQLEQSLRRRRAGAES